MKFRYIGSGKESPRKITFMGTEEFTLGEVSEVHDAFCIEKLMGNKCFELVQDEGEGIAAEESVESQSVPVITTYARPRGRPKGATTRT
jgi:hypothetical protein